ncbi:MAG: hypothetical protein E7373_06800 [Clostridiales bacterium]|nr:hypothetical protein [Clostridiales bacterium]
MKRTKITTRVIALILSVLTCLSITACAGPSGGPSSGKGDKNTTLIYIEHFGGGVGRVWLDDAIVRFKDLVKEKSYEEGKKGVSFDISSSTYTDTATMQSSGRNLYFDKVNNISNYIESGMIYPIDDIVKSVIEQKEGQDVTLESKLNDEYRGGMKGSDGKYYVLPHYEFYNGASYDMDLFENEGLYFADSNNGTEYTCELTGKTVYFINEDYRTKSVGNDGKSGTADDGMPTTLEEMVALCDYMKNEKEGLSAFVVSGNHVDYTHYFLLGLWGALSGYEEIRSTYTFDSNGKEIQWVSGYSDENLFAGVDTIKKPIVTKETIDSADEGWKTTKTLGKYYAMAFLQLALEKGWIDDRWESGTFMHSDAMNAFVMNGVGKLPKVASIMEGSYWYNEAKGYGNFQSYYDRYKREKNIGWFNFPTSFDKAVTSESNAREEALVASTTFAFINGNLLGKEEKKGVVDACKDFLKFLFTDKELVAFTETTGVRIAKTEYEVDLENSGLSTYQKSVLQLAQNTRVVLQEADNPTFKKSPTTFIHALESIGFSPEKNGRTYGTVIQAMQTAKMSAADCLDSVSISESKWISSYLQK